MEGICSHTQQLLERLNCRTVVQTSNTSMSSLVLQQCTSACFAESRQGCLALLLLQCCIHLHLQTCTYLVTC